jgi:predicted nucleotidyltransferase component of viral defense system
MSRKIPKNVAASIRNRLLEKARKENRRFDELLQYYAMERFLYRLMKSAYKNTFILKGALMLRVWQAPIARPTIDIDLLGVISNEVANIVEQILEICTTAVEKDGLVFDPNSVKGKRIIEEAEYEGVNIQFYGRLDTAKIKMRIDIGFGDVVFPNAQKMDLPTVLDFPSPRLSCYSMESTIAEKLEAMIRHGELNSRMKDFYDVWLLGRQFDFDGGKLSEAIRRTVENRGTVLPKQMTAFTEKFIKDGASLWNAFRERLHIEEAPCDFSDIIHFDTAFLQPVIDAVRSGSSLSIKWVAPGPWKL